LAPTKRQERGKSKRHLLQEIYKEIKGNKFEEGI
jgi:hypothetical protein